MLQIDTLILGLYQTNCYIVYQEDSDCCIVIDPGYEADRILDHCKSIGRSICAVLLTHGHFDHVGAVRDLAADTGCKVYICAADLQLPVAFTAGKLYYTDTYDEGDNLTEAGVSFHVLRTPGHTPGSVCLLCGDVIFSGDTLFAGSCGRTDFPLGSFADIRQSLNRLAQLSGDYTVYPGHGSATRLSQERQANPYL